MRKENHGGMISRGGTPIYPPELSCNPTRRDIYSKAGGTGKGNEEFCLTKCRFHTSKDSL